MNKKNLSNLINFSNFRLSNLEKRNQELKNLKNDIDNTQNKIISNITSINETGYEQLNDFYLKRAMIEEELKYYSKLKINKEDLDTQIGFINRQITDVTIYKKKLDFIKKQIKIKKTKATERKLSKTIDNFISSKLKK